MRENIKKFRVLLSIFLAFLLVFGQGAPAFAAIRDITYSVSTNGDAVTVTTKVEADSEADFSSMDVKQDLHKNGQSVEGFTLAPAGGAITKIADSAYSREYQYTFDKSLYAGLEGVYSSVVKAVYGEEFYSEPLHVFNIVDNPRTISGTLSLPGQDMAISGPINAMVSVDVAGVRVASQNVTIPAGLSSTPYTLSNIPAGSDYYVYYTLPSGLGYRNTGYYSGSGTVAGKSEATLLDVSAGDLTNISLTAIKNTDLIINMTDSVMHPTKPIIYISDKDNKRLYALNYQTQAVSTINFELPPERITFANNEVYVCLLKGQHSSYWWEEDQQGAVAIIDAETFTLKEQFDIALDPYDILIGRDGYIYISSGSGQWTSINSYSRDTKTVIGTASIRQMSTIGLNPFYDRIYSMETDGTPVLVTYKVANGQMTQENFNLDKPVAAGFKFSPDGKYLFNYNGNIFKCASSPTEDTTYVRTLGMPYTDMTFNADGTTFYIATASNRVIVYNYATYDVLGYYNVSADIKGLYQQNGNIIALTKDSAGLYHIEMLSPSDMIPARTISGKVLLPNSQKASAGGMKVELTISSYQYTYKKTVTIPEGTSSTDYSIGVLPISGYKIKYNVTPSNNLQPIGYYNIKGCTVNESGASPIDVSTADKSNLDITLIGKYNISGTITLPVGASNSERQLWIYAQSSLGSSQSTISIPPGATSVQYTLPVNQASDYIVYYQASSYWFTEYISTGYYSTEGIVTVQSKASIIDMTKGDQGNINIQLLPKKKISGTISLGEGVAPSGGFRVTVNAHYYLNSKVVTIPAGQSSANYELYIDSTQSIPVFYATDNQPGYINKGFYTANKTVRQESLCEKLDLTTGDKSNINLTIIPEKEISGTLSLPDQAVASTDLYAAIYAVDEQGLYHTSIIIPKGSSSASYTIKAAGDSAYTVYYSTNANDTLKAYCINGFYNSQGTVKKKVDAGLVDLRTGSKKDINLTLIETGSIKGMVSRPAGSSTADEILVTIHAQSSTNYHDTQVTIPAGSSSISYQIYVQDSTDYIVNYSVGLREYASCGYYSSSGTTRDRELASPIDTTQQSHSNINLEIIGTNILRGTISFESNKAALDNVAVYIYADDGKERRSALHIIPKGATSVNYQMLVPKGLDYVVSSAVYNNKYQRNSYYNSSGSVKFVKDATPIDFVNSEQSNINLTIFDARKMSGKLSLPSGTAPTGGIDARVWVSAINPISVKIPEGSRDVSYEAYVQEGASYMVFYSATAPGYKDSGYYTDAGTTESYLDYQSITVGAGDITDANLTLLPQTNRTVSGTITLPQSVTAENGMNITLWVSNGMMAERVLCNISKGSSTATYVIDGISAYSGYKVYYQIENISGYINKGYYSTSGMTTTASGATLLDLTTEDKTNININPIPGISATNVTLNKTALSLKSGAEEKLTAAITPDNATYKTVTWKSGNTNIATVSADGLVKAINPGTTTITAVSVSDEEVKADCTITVTADTGTGTGGTTNPPPSGSTPPPPPVFIPPSGNTPEPASPYTTEAGQAAEKSTTNIENAVKGAINATTVDAIIKAAAEIAAIKVANENSIIEVAQNISSAVANIQNAMTKTTDPTMHKKLADSVAALLSIMTENTTKVQTQENTDKIISLMADVLKDANDMAKEAANEQVKTTLQGMVQSTISRFNTAIVTPQGDNKTVKTVIAAEQANAIITNIEWIGKLENKLQQSGIKHTATQSITIQAAPKAAAQEVQLQIPTAIVDTVKAKGFKETVLNMGIASISLPADALNTAQAGAVTLSVKNMDSAALTAEQKEKVGSAKVYDFNMVLTKADGTEAKISQFKSELTVQIPYTLQPGEDPQKITVFYMDDKNNLVNMIGVYDETTKSVRFITDHFSKYVVKYNPLTYRDIAKANWAKNAIEVMAAKGIITGKPDGTFAPNDTITRGQFVTMLVKAVGAYDKDAQYSFSDVKAGDWYYAAVASAAQAGILAEGSGSKFRPNENITREEMAVMIRLALEKFKGIEGKADMSVLEGFADKASIADGARESVAIVAKYGIITGKPGKVFEAKGIASRAEAAVVVYRLFGLE